MRRAWAILLAAAALAVVAGCGGDDGGPGTAGQEQGATGQQTDGDAGQKVPREEAVAVLRAVVALARQGTEAAASVSDLGRSEIPPGPRGAALLVDRGGVELKRFCAADSRAREAVGPKAKEAFASGWKQAAAPGLGELGEEMYGALAGRCP